MNLKNDAIEEFKKMYKVMYGVVLTDTQANEYAHQLITLVKAVYGKNIPKRIDSMAEK